MEILYKLIHESMFQLPSKVRNRVHFDWKKNITFSEIAGSVADGAIIKQYLSLQSHHGKSFHELRNVVKILIIIFQISYETILIYLYFSPCNIIHSLCLIVYITKLKIIIPSDPFVICITHLLGSSSEYITSFSLISHYIQSITRIPKRSSCSLYTFRNSVFKS